MKFNPIMFSSQRQAEQDRMDKLVRDLKVREIVALSYDREGKANFHDKPVLIEKYDPDGSLVESYRQTEDFIDERVMISIDANGNRIKTVSYNDQDYYKYDQDGRMLEYGLYRPNKRLRTKSRFHYEAISENRVHCSEINCSGKLVGKSITKFNPNFRKRCIEY